MRGHSQRPLASHERASFAETDPSAALRSALSPTKGRGEEAPDSRLPLRFQPRHRHALTRQLIGAFVLGVAGMALDPVPAHLMRLQRSIEALPQFGVLHRLLV